jgi:signal transduction histidine kinase
MQPPDVQIEIEEPLPPVMAQPSYLTQVLSNLLGNAIKFVPPGRTPEICVSAQRQGNRVKITFQDNGIGIEPKDRERIFNIFERVHDRESYEGTGIGLSIVRKATERMGGSVGVESGRGQGSCFWIELIAA